MKAAIATFLMVLCLTSFAFDDPEETGHTGWQLPLLKNDDLSIKTWFGTYSNHKESGEGNARVLPATIETRLVAEPGQSILACAENILWKKDSPPAVVAATLTNDNEPVFHIRMARQEALLTLTRPYQCPETLRQSYLYSSASPFMSDGPFLVSFVEKPDKRAEGSSKDPLPLIPSSQSLPTPDTLYGNGGGLSFDDYRDDFFRRRPGGGFIGSGKDITLTLLPLMRLDWDWQRILPMSQWRHWLLGTRDESAGITLAIRFNQGAPVYLQISQTEFRALSNVLHDTRQVLDYLAPRLSGRQAFIEQLLTLNGSAPELARQTRQAIRRQVAALLDWPDAEFNLDFEISQLSRALSASIPPEWIQQFPLPKTKKQKEVKGGGGKSSGATKNTSGQQDGIGQNEGQYSDSRNPGEPPSGASAAGSRPNTATTGSQLTITLLGRFDAGKSSLANCLLGFDHFEVKVIQTEKYEPDAVIQPERSAPERTIRVRSLPGYGSEEIEEWLRAHPIDPSEVLVLVSGESMDEDDFEVLKELDDRGHDISRMVFVRNKFDSTLNAKLEQLQQQDNPGAVEDITSDLQADLHEEFQEDLQSWLAHVRQDLSYINLHFTSCASPYKCSGVEDVLRAIEGQLRGDEKITFRDFVNIRSAVPDRLSLYSRWFLVALDLADDDITRYVLRQIAQHQSELFQQLPENLVSQLREKFREQYGFSYNDTALRLRYLETWGNAESNMVQRHAEALLSCSGIDDRERYLADLQERISLFRGSGCPESLLQMSLDFSAAYKAEQYVSVFRETLLRGNRSWFSRDSQFLSTFQAQLYRAIDASLTIANCQRELARTDQAQGYIPDTVLVTEASGTFREELLARKKELAGQFTRVFMNLVMAKLYNLPDSEDSSTQPPPETSNPDTVVGDDKDSPIVYGLSQMLETTDQMLGRTPPETLESDVEPPEPPAEAGHTLAENTVMVTLANGFTRQYRLTDNTPLFSVQELAAALAAFEVNSELAEAMAKPEGAKTLYAATSQGGNRYHYRFISVDKGWGDEIGRASIDIWHTAGTTGEPQQSNLWVNFDRSAVGSALLGMQAGAVMRLNGHPFAPRTFVYNSPGNDQTLTRTLLITQSRVSNLGQVMILQNTVSSNASEYLQDSPLHDRNKLTGKELIRLALHLAEGMKALADRQLHLKRLDVAGIAIQSETLAPYVADPLTLRVDNPGEIGRAVLANLRRSDSQQEDQDAGTTMPESQIVYWLGQMFTLLSGKAPIFYQKSIVPRLRLLTNDELHILEAYKDEQLKDTVTDALARERIRPNLVGRYPEVSREKSAVVNLLLLARSMLRGSPASRPALTKVIHDLKKILPHEPGE